MALNVIGYTKSYTLIGHTDTGEGLKDVVQKNLGDFYVKVDAVDSNKEKASATVLFIRDGLSMFNSRYEFAPSVIDGSGNFIKQAYEYLKTLPEFADAVDC